MRDISVFNINHFSLQIVKLNAIDSTNTYLKNLSKKKVLADETVVWAENQNAGRGQMGSAWESKAGQSLTFSVFKRFENLPVSGQFAIAMAVSIAIKKVLDRLAIPSVSIKWPNDIMSHHQKVGGILIENQLENELVSASVIGIGLNVNETAFENAPQATSLFLSKGFRFSLEEVFDKTVREVLMELKGLEKRDVLNLKTEYERHLFRKGLISVFEDSRQTRFNGIIKSVTKAGKLRVETLENGVQKFDLKEVKLCF